MIKSFKCKDTEALYQGKRIRQFESFKAQAEKRLEILDNAKTIHDLMGLPSNRFEALTGDETASTASA